jgi:deoxycytidylate deaminase
MNKNKLNKLVDLSMPLLRNRPGSSRHISFIVKRNKILSVGLNNSSKTHPLSQKYGHRFASIHSELDAILIARSLSDFNGSTLINIRLSSLSFHKKYNRPILRSSKPCGSCMRILAAHPEIKKVYFTNDDGFEQLF